MTSSFAKRRNNGFVLVVVLCIVLLLTALLLVFNQKSRAQLLATEQSRYHQQALFCARAGLEIVIACLKSPQLYSPGSKLWSILSGQKEIALADGSCTIQLTSESAKLNINQLSDRNGRLNRPAVDRLLRLIELLNRRRSDEDHISYSIVAALIDWIDPDERLTYLPFVAGDSVGAESDYYLTLDRPYRCRNAPCQTIEELVAVKGFSPQLLQQLRPYITTKGDGRVDLNTAPPLVLQSLSESIDEALVQMIVERRRFKPFASVAELRDVPGMTDSIFYAVRNVLTVRPKNEYFTVIARGKAGQAEAWIRSMLRRNTTEGRAEIVMYQEL